MKLTKKKLKEMVMEEMKKSRLKEGRVPKQWSEMKRYYNKLQINIKDAEENLSELWEWSENWIDFVKRNRDTYDDDTLEMVKRSHERLNDIFSRIQDVKNYIEDFEGVIEP